MVRPIGDNEKPNEALMVCLIEGLIVSLKGEIMVRLKGG